jgi:rod shape determining protein RodA
MPKRLARIMSPKVSERSQADEVARRLGALPLRHLDWTLLSLTFFLVAFGMLVQYSATRSDIPGNPAYYVIRQGLACFLGVVLLILFIALDYRRLKVATSFIYGFFLLFLLLVFFAEATMGSQRWIQLGPFNFQPSEFCKLVLVLVLANYLSESRADPHTLRWFIVPVLWSLPYMLLVFLQPDLGTTLVMAAVLLGMLFLAGCRMRHWLGFLGAGTLAFVLGFVFKLFKPYQIERFTAFLRQDVGVQEAGYQLMQSKIAIGSGQLVGKGLFHGTQTHLKFIPAHHTDFVFAVVGEELGLVGALLLIGAFALLVWRFLRIANNARDLYGALIVLGVTTMFAFQVAVNIGMTIGIMPITGIPLPFISYGGSSLMVNLAAVGLAQGIHMRRFSQV